jgi:hypothetical protein
VVTLRPASREVAGLAPFDRERGDLVAGEGACATCPKLAGNDPDLADELDADACTDGDCFRAKCDAHLSLVLNEVRATGATIIEGDAAAMLLPYDGAVRPYGHVLLSDTAIPNVTSETGETTHLSYRETMAQLGDAAPQPVFIVHPQKPGVLVACLPREDAERVKALAAGESLEESNQEAEKGYDPLAGIPESEWPFATHADQLEAATFEAAVQRTERTSYELLMVCRALAMDRYGFDDKLHRAMGWHDELHQALTDEGPDGEPKEAEHSDEESFVIGRLSSCSPDELARFATLVALQCHPLGWGAEKRASLREMTDHYCIDVASIAAPEASDDDGRDDAETNPPLLPAARAADGGTLTRRTSLRPTINPLRRRRPSKLRPPRRSRRVPRRRRQRCHAETLGPGSLL